MANAATGVRDIAGAAGNDVNMEVRDSLAAGLALVKANIEPVWRKSLKQQLPTPLDSAGESVLFRRV
jgi:hypothetical protein